MRINTLYLPGFSHRLCGSRSNRSAKSLINRAPKLDGLAKLVSRFVTPSTFDGIGKRDRIFTPWVTFCAFLGQVLQRGASCRDAVRRVQAWHLQAGSSKSVDEGTGGYCQARARLPIKILRTVFNALAKEAHQRSRRSDRWFGHNVKVIDGGGLSMPDTQANREVYPYAGCQREGCGFPTGQIVGLFSLATGHLVRFMLSSWKAHEAPLARQLIDWIQKGEVLLADRGFCNWGLISLLQGKGVEVVMRLHQRRKTGTGVVCWAKPQRQGRWEKDPWAQLPQHLTLRVVRFRVEVRGFHRSDRSGHHLAGSNPLSGLGHRRALPPPLASRTELSGYQNDSRPRCAPHPYS